MHPSIHPSTQRIQLALWKDSSGKKKDNNANDRNSHNPAVGIASHSIQEASVRDGYSKILHDLAIHYAYILYMHILYGSWLTIVSFEYFFDIQ